MNIKTQITFGFLAVLALLLAMGTYAHYTVQRLDRSSRTILKDNFYSVQLGQGMLQDLDAAEAAPASPEGLPRFGEQLRREAGNVTEPGEQPLVDSLTAGLTRYDQLSAEAPARPAALAHLRRLTHRMVALNMQALTRKNEQANRTAVGAGRTLLAFITISLLVAMGLALGVPEAAVGGLRKLSASIEHAAQGNFTASIPVESHDEFGQVAQAFNRLLVHLGEFRDTNLAEVLTHYIAHQVEVVTRRT